MNSFAVCAFGWIGDKNYENVTLEDVSNIGNVRLTSSTVTGTMNITGNLSAVHSSMHKIDVTGNVRLTESKVTGTFDVVGDLTSINSSINNIDVAGEAKITHTTILGTAGITGDFVSLDSTFLSSITVVSKSVKFKNSTIHDLYIKSNNKDKPKSKVFLNGGEVLGNIIFDYNNGEIYVSNNAKINGKVIGGIIIKN